LFSLVQSQLIRVPPLEERREDLPLIIVRILQTVGAEQGKQIQGVALETLDSLLVHPFEGQMTELLGELRRLVSATPEGEMVRGSVRRSAISATSPDEMSPLSRAARRKRIAVLACPWPQCGDVQHAQVASQVF